MTEEQKERFLTRFARSFLREEAAAEAVPAPSRAARMWPTAVPPAAI